MAANGRTMCTPSMTGPPLVFSPNPGASQGGSAPHNQRTPGADGVWAVDVDAGQHVGYRWCMHGLGREAFTTARADSMSRGWIHFRVGTAEIPAGRERTGTLSDGLKVSSAGARPPRAWRTPPRWLRARTTGGTVVDFVGIQGDRVVFHPESKPVALAARATRRAESQRSLGRPRPSRPWGTKSDSEHSGWTPTPLACPTRSSGNRTVT